MGPDPRSGHAVEAPSKEGVLTYVPVHTEHDFFNLRPGQFVKASRAKFLAVTNQKILTAGQLYKVMGVSIVERSTIVRVATDAPGETTYIGYEDVKEEPAKPVAAVEASAPSLKFSIPTYGPKVVDDPNVLISMVRKDASHGGHWARMSDVEAVVLGYESHIEKLLDIIDELTEQLPKLASRTVESTDHQDLQDGNFSAG